MEFVRIDPVRWLPPGRVMYRASMTLCALSLLLAGPAMAGPGWAPRGGGRGRVQHAEP